jgi:Ca-activated chloride channel family protein
MGEELALERAAALRFFRAFLGPGDRGSFLLFDDRVNQVVPFTDDVEWLEEGTRTLRARGGTALYDSLAVALHAFGGVRGRRALVLFSDGHDEHSSLDYEGVRDLLRRAGVTLYAVHLYEIDALPPGLTLPGDGRKRSSRAASRDRDTSRLRALARGTGGVFQSVRNESQLDEAFRRIDADLRTQYRIVYQSSNTSEDPSFRTVEVRSRRRGVSLRAPAGYIAD